MSERLLCAGRTWALLLRISVLAWFCFPERYGFSPFDQAQLLTAFSPDHKRRKACQLYQRRIHEDHNHRLLAGKKGIKEEPGQKLYRPILKKSYWTKGHFFKPSVLSAQQAISLAPVGGKGLASSGAGEQLPCLSLVGNFNIPRVRGQIGFQMKVVLVRCIYLYEMLPMP